MDKFKDKIESKDLQKMCYFISLSSETIFEQKGIEESILECHNLIANALPKNLSVNFNLDIKLDDETKFQRQIISQQFVERFKKIVICNNCALSHNTNKDKFLVGS